MTGNTEMIRASGITEQIGEVDLACNSTSLTPLGSAVTAQFTLQVNGTITNSTGSGLKTMAGAAVQYDLAPFAIPYTVQGVVATAGNHAVPERHAADGNHVHHPVLQRAGGGHYAGQPALEPRRPS